MEGGPGWDGEWTCPFGRVEVGVEGLETRKMKTCAGNSCVPVSIVGPSLDPEPDLAKNPEAPLHIVNWVPLTFLPSIPGA